MGTDPPFNTLPRMTDPAPLLDSLRRIADGTPDALGLTPQQTEAVRSGDADYIVADAMRALARRTLDEWRDT